MTAPTKRKSDTDALSPAERLVMKQTMKAAILRAADIIDRITQDDVVDAQMALFNSGVRLEALARIDRALIASCHLRACAELGQQASEKSGAELQINLLKNRVSGKAPA